MLKPQKYAWTLILTGALFLSACGLSGNTTPTVSPETQLTAVASTVQAQLTQAAVLTPSATPTTEPLAPTEAEIQTTPTSEELPTSIVALPTEVGTTATQAPLAPATLAPIFTAAPPKTASGDKALLIQQDPADGTVYKPEKKFKVSWTFRNVGTTTWSKKYQLRFYGGDQMHKDASKTISSTTPPGEDTTFTVEMIAPTKVGDYRSGWVITNEDGVNFGSVFIAIKVKE